MAAFDHPISALPVMLASRARTTVACLLMGLAVLAASCAMTASAQNGDGTNLGFGVRASAAEFAAGAGSPGQPRCKGNMLPNVKVKTLNLTVYNGLDFNLPVVRTNATLGSPKVIVVAPPKSEPTPLHVHVVVSASSVDLIIQVLSDKEYVNVSNAASMVVALTGNLSIVVVNVCKSVRGVRGLLLEVTNELKLETQKTCVEMTP